MQNAEQKLTLAEALDHARELFLSNRFAEAEMIYRQILAHDPRNANAMHMLGLLFNETKRRPQAVEIIRQAIALVPKSAELYNNLGAVLDDMLQFDPAIECYRKALELKPDYAEAYSNLGNSLKDSGRIEEAIPNYRRAIQLKPDYALAHHNLATALHMVGQIDEAYVECRRALEIQPDFALAHTTLGMMHITDGDFARGWPEYEWRRGARELNVVERPVSQPLWEGGDLAGKTILLQCEQGLGDTMHYVRYAPMIARRGGKVLLEVQPSLVRLLSNSPELGQVFAQSQPLPPFDLHCPLPSLPARFGTTLDTIPSDIPYIFPDPAIAERWAKRIPKDGRLKVGLSWAGRKEHVHDRDRSLPLALLAPFAEAKNVWFCSLQKGPPSTQAKNPPKGMDLADWSEELTDFAETAGLLANLDLLISVDTAVIHLAGAMAKPTWVLLHFMPDWRWMLERDDSPWYATFRLFRQVMRGDWSTPMRRASEALKSRSLLKEE